MVAGKISGLGSALALLQVLIQTFSAVGLGYFCVRAGYINPTKGDMQAVEFFVGRLALPLLVFKIIATADVESLDIGVIVSCNLGKVSVFLLTFFTTHFAYRTRESRGQRLLTANVFGFFVTASNDLAIGLPVIHGIYGEKMSFYMAANVLVFQTILQPTVMLLFELGKATRLAELNVCDHGSESGDSHDGMPLEGLAACGQVRRNPERSFRQVARLGLYSVIKNPILIATVAGLVYSYVFAWSLEPGDDSVGMKLPQPLHGIIKLWTGPFQMLFLFMNGASLRTAKVGVWSIWLVLMKVMVCAYVSYGFACLLVSTKHPDYMALKEFTFFYGTIPAGGAPLIFAKSLDCGVDIIASASIFGLVLAGPIEFMTSLFLSAKAGNADYNEVSIFQNHAAQACFVCNVIMVVFLSFGFWGSSSGVFIMGAYALCSLFLETVTMQVLRDQSLCHSQVTLFMFCVLQNIAYVLLIVMWYMVNRRWKDGENLHLTKTFLGVLSVSVLSAVLVSDSNTLHELCGVNPTDEQTFALLIWNTILLLTFVAIAWWGRRQKLQERERLVEAARSPPLSTKLLEEELAQTPSVAVQELSELAQTPSVAVQDVAPTLALLQVLRALMQVVNLLASTYKYGVFTPMLILATCIEHGQGCVLLLFSIFHPIFIANIQKVFARIAVIDTVNGELVMPTMQRSHSFGGEPSESLEVTHLLRSRSM
eukprot:TRINITY_DN7860_c0_g1_i1.p1 TRINITY_DN7860_c0_g1~~TRINITY_DN7860_c0_g1_i1.p1  ORF type:complete len:708 (-),score=116.78 TRINITY_DN7860_c0_g1_i1:258-2381(-)